MKKLVLLAVTGIMLAGLSGLVGCASVMESSPEKDSIAAIKATIIADEILPSEADNKEMKSVPTVLEGLVNSGVTVKVGEFLTFPVAVNTEKAFSSFDLAIGFDSSKIEIVESSLAGTDKSFAGIYAFNKDYIPESFDQFFLQNSWQRNYEMGFSSTALAAGASLEEFKGNVILFTLTVKGVSVGEAKLNLTTLHEGFFDSEGQVIEVPSLPQIAITVEE